MQILHVDECGVEAPLESKLPPAPSIVLVWDPMEVARWQNLTDLDSWWFAGTVADTQPGERAVIYRTKQDQGIAGLFDFASPPFPHPGLRRVAFGRPFPLPAPIPRSELVSGDLGRIFSHIQGRRRIDHQAGRSLQTLLAPVPPWQSIDEPLPVDETEYCTWIPARGDVGWAVESAMRDAIAAHPPSWRYLGFSAAPQPEVLAPGCRLRLDLWGQGLVVECKLVAGTSALEQLDRYLAHLRKADSTASCKGHLVVAAG